MDKIERIKELIVQLNQYRNSYYNNSISEISDYEYDNLFDELKKLEEETNIMMANSPTHTVGYEIKSKLEKVKHSHAMLSLDKTKSVDDLVEFSNGKDCILSLKMDGLTILNTYDNGTLYQSETRGNGEEGEIVTHNARMFDNLPLNIPFDRKFEIEGEAIITQSDFENINVNGEYKNCRNLASGSVRQLDSNITKNRHVKFIAWKIPFGLTTYSYGFELAVKWGFDVVPYVKYNSSTDNIEEKIEELKSIAKEKSYPIDGLVCTYDNIEYGKSLGTTRHHPKHSLAYKFYDEEVTTVLNDIEWSMGKTGELTPVAIFDEIELEGTTVSRASLHNVSICKELQLSIGDEITVYKANQIIPQVRDNLTRSNNFFIPDKCPICGGDTKLVKDNNTEVLVCANPDCKGKLLGKLSHFCSKNAINIEGMSEATLQFLIDREWVKSFKDIYRLDYYREPWKRYDGFGDKSVDKLLESIEKSRNTTLDRFIYALCIPLIGKTASKTIAKKFKNVEEFYDKWCHDYDFTQLDDFGNTMNDSMQNFITNNYMWIAELIAEFIFRDSDNNGNVKNVLEGKNFVITGSLNYYKNRDELIAVIERCGGKVSGSVSSKTSYLINNDVASKSGKNKKAIGLGIPIISESDFIEIYLDGGTSQKEK